MSSDISECTLRRRFPHPIAAAWHRASHLAENSEQRITYLIACNEIFLRWLSAMLLPDYLRGEPSPVVETVLNRFGQYPPTDGVWLRLVRELIRAVGQRQQPAPFMPEIYSWFFNANGTETRSAKLLADFIDLRNRVIHPTSLTPDLTREHVFQLQEKLLAALMNMGWLMGYRPFRVASVETTRSGTFRGKVQFLVGREEHNDFVHGEWAPHLVKQAVYLTNPSGTALLDLAPFVEHHQDHLYLFKTIPELRALVLVNDMSGLEMRKLVESGEHEIEFKVWLRQRDKHNPHFSIGTNSSVFRLGTQETADTQVDLGPRFEKREVLGRGGMAVVFRVFDRHTNEERALKVLKRDLAEDDTACKRFWREAQNMDRVRHDRIMRRIEIGKLPNGQPFLMMPVMPKGNLQDHILAGSPRPEPLVRRWAQDGLEALECIHQSEIVHRDIKPSNFLVDENDHVMLTDFGIALAPSDEHWTETIGRMVTAAYMAPEQARSRDVSVKADIYSLAIVLHELLTGSRPKDLPGKGIRGRFGDLIRKMGSLDPEDRPTATRALIELTSLPPVRNPTRVSKAAGTRVPNTSGAHPVAEKSDAPLAVVAPAAAEAETHRIAEEQEVIRREAEAGAAEEAERQRAEQEAQQRTMQQATLARRQRWQAVAIFALLFAVNWLETRIETSLRDRRPVGLQPAEVDLAEAAMWLERGLSFEHYESAGTVASWSFTIVYFGIFPVLLITTAVIFVRRRDPRHFLLLAMSAAVDYALTLPFYLFLPVPERWSYPDANAILLSDNVDERLIEVVRPFSGLNNCFPSFHVSLTVIALICLYRAKAPFRRTAVLLGAAVILSTFAIGVHWLSDIVAGLALGIFSAWTAARVLSYSAGFGPRRIRVHS